MNSVIQQDIKEDIVFVIMFLFSQKHKIKKGTVMNSSKCRTDQRQFYVS